MNLRKPLSLLSLDKVGDPVLTRNLCQWLIIPFLPSIAMLNEVNIGVIRLMHEKATYSTTVECQGLVVVKVAKATGIR